MTTAKIDYTQLFSMRKTARLPIILQNEIAECGIACLAMISHYFGHEIDLKGMRRLFPTASSGMGISMAKLVDLSHVLGLQTRALKLPLDKLKELTTPAILHWDLQHFVVLKQVKRNKVIIHDPAKGRCVLGLDEVSKHFTGIALEFKKAATFKKIVQKEKISILSTVGGLTGWIVPAITIFCISLLLEVFSLTTPFYMQWVLDQVVVTADVNLLTLLVMIFLALAILNPTLSAFRTWCLSRISAMINIQWLNNVTNHLFKLPLEWFEKRGVGDVLSRMSSVDAIESTLSGNLITSLLNGIMSIVLIVIMYIYSSTMTFFLLGLLLCYTLFRAFYFRVFRNMQENILNLSAEQQSEILESIRGMSTIKLANLNSKRLSRYLNKSIASSNARLRLARLDIIFTLFNSLLFGVGRILLIWYSVKLTLANQFTVGALVAYLAYCDMFTRTVVEFVDRAIQFYMLKLHAERLSDITFTPPERAAENTTLQAVPVISSDTSLVLRDISFKYNGESDWIFEKFNLTIESGDSVAIVGPSGCGKTTLAKIMLGLLESEQGSIHFGGHNIKNMGINNYRNVIGCVMQNDALFAGTIADNICLFADEPNQDEIIAAAKAANIHDDIMNMTMNYFSLVGDMGSFLSGGQKQRIILARALYRKPKLLILDEATSHLDVENEKTINQVLASLNITRIIIAHRQETIASANRVVNIMEHKQHS